MFGFGPKYATSDAVTLKKDTVLKKVDPRFVETEVRVTRAAYDLARTTNLFYVPQIIRYDRNSGLIEFERIKGLLTIRQLLAKKPDDIEILRRVGKALAYVHTNLELPGSLSHHTSLNWECSSEDIVPLHGDFTLTNITYKKDDDLIVILDWASAPALRSRIILGSRYFDVAHFLYNLVVQHQNVFFAGKHFRYWAHAFLEGYEGDHEIPIDCHILYDYLFRISALHLQLGVLFPWPVHWKYLYYATRRALGHVILMNLTKEWLHK